MAYSTESYRDLQHATTSASKFDYLFAPKDSGYLGADAALSIPLNDGRIIWIFGDTLIGRREHSRRIFDAMPRNTIALQSPGSARSENIEWILTNEIEEPADFFNLPLKEHNKWFWPGTGICIDGQFFLFGYGVTYAEGECEALSFRILDSWLMRVRDTSGHPRDWQIESIPLLHPYDRAWFCSACLFEFPFLYLLGVQFSQGPRSSRISSSVLARVHVEDLFENGNSCTFKYWSRGKESRRWTSGINQPDILYRPGVTECSLYYDAPRERYLATTYLPRKPEFCITTAPSLTGPWSSPAIIFREQETKPVHTHLFYTFRMHPHLASHEDEMILTYVVNTRTVSDLLKNCNVYFPRFIKTDLSQI